MKKIKIAAIAACSTLVLFTCAQGLSVNEKSETVEVARSYTDNEIDFEWVGLTGTFVFKNGSRVRDYVSSYENKGGKVTVGVYFTTVLNSWMRSLEWAGIPYEVNKTSNPFRNSEISFASDLVRSRK